MHFVIVDVAPEPVHPGVGQDDPAAQFLVALRHFLVPVPVIGIEHLLTLALGAHDRRDAIVIGNRAQRENRHEQYYRRHHGIPDGNTERRHYPEIQPDRESHQGGILERASGVAPVADLQNINQHQAVLLLESYQHAHDRGVPERMVVHRVLRVHTRLMRVAVVRQVELAVGIKWQQRERRQRAAEQLVPERRAAEDAVDTLMREHAETGDEHAVEEGEHADRAPLEHEGKRWRKRRGIDGVGEPIRTKH